MADSTPPEGSFFGRWSQRKVQARTGALPVDAPTQRVQPVQPVQPLQSTLPAIPVVSAAVVMEPPTGQAAAAEVAGRQPETPDDPPSPSPSLEDVAKLTADSDYSAFAARTVDPNVRNAAMRKLFSANPHFNVMDGLDVYIDDYSVGEPILKSMLRQMVQARSLGLLDDELVDQDKPPSAEMPTALAANDTAPIHENSDLQLQRDDAAGHSGVDERVEAGAEVNSDTSPEPGPTDHRPG